MNISMQNKAIAVVFLVFTVGLGVVNFTHAAQQTVSLHEAVGLGDLKMVIALLATEAGKAQLDKKQWPHQQTPLHIAVEGCHIDVAQLLLAYGVDTSVVCSIGRTPLYDAVGMDLPLAMVQLLLRQGADANIAESELGWTPLHRVAAEESRVGMAYMLVSFGADIDAQDLTGKTPLQMGEKTGQSMLLLRSNKYLDAMQAWSEQLQKRCGFPKVLVEHLVLPMVLSEAQCNRLAALESRPTDRTENFCLRKRVRRK